MPTVVQEEQDGSRQCTCARNWPRDPVAEKDQSDATENEHYSERKKVVESEAGNRMSGTIGARIFMFPGVDEEAVEAAERREYKRDGQQREAQFGATGDRGDKRRSCKAETHGDLLRQTMCNLLLSRRAVCGMDENEVARDHPPKDQVEANGCGVELGKKSRKSNGGENDSRKKSGAMAVMEVVASLEALLSNRISVQQARVHQTIGSVKHPNGKSHRERRRERKIDLVGRSDEPGPKSSDSWSIEREKMPERKGSSVGAHRFQKRFGWGRGGHLLQFNPAARFLIKTQSTYNPCMLRTLLSVAAIFFPFAVLHAQSSIATNSPNGQPLSTRVVAYNIEARLDTEKKSLDATETLTYKNFTGQSLNTIPFHLYLNAFRPESTFTSETHFNGGVRDPETENNYPAEKLGSITISHIDADGYGDLTSSMHFIAPDDGNAQDHTVAEITLPHSLAPNESITFRLVFHDQFPLSVARNGYKRNFIMGGQWYPKPGVFWHGAWNCHQYHATTEFFSDFATFNVSLTLPRRYIVGASGVPTGEVINPAAPGKEDTKTVSFYGEDIGDFAWAASPNFTVTDGTFLSSLGPVKIHVLALAAHPRAGPRYLNILQKTLAQFGQRYGPYPYKIITAIDPEPDSEMGGMEYPTLFTGETYWYEPTYITEQAVEHEFGHQYWYGMVATNEFEDAWLDEGINSYTEVKVLDAILGRNTSVFNRPYANAGDYEAQRLEYLFLPDYDPVTRWAFKFRDSESYGGVTYGKSATLLATLESLIGRDTMDEAMRTYFLRYRFTHPTTEDFLRTIEQVAIARGKAIPLTPPPSLPPQNPVILSGVEEPALSLSKQPAVVFPSVPPFTSTGNPDYATAPVINSSLRGYFNQAVYGTQILDYTVDSISSEPTQWWLPSDKKNIQYLSTVYLHRKGDFIFPIIAEIVFDDGTHIRERWNGVDRWTKFSYTRSAKIVSAEIDPDHTILLDSNFFNNSYTTVRNPIPARKITNLWLSFNQLVAQLVAWIV
jgi:Peptidase family M1 domain